MYEYFDKSQSVSINVQDDFKLRSLMYSARVTNLKKVWLSCIEA